MVSSLVAAELDTIRLLAPSGSRIELSGFYVAQEHGYYASQGLVLQVLRVPSGVDLLPMLQGHLGDFALVPPEALIQKKSPPSFLSFMALYQHSPYMDLQNHSSKKNQKEPWVSVHVGRDTYPLMDQGVPFQLAYNKSLALGNCMVGLATQFEQDFKRTQRFVESTRQGFDWVLNHPRLSAQLVQKHMVPPVSLSELLFEAQMFVYFNPLDQTVFGDQSSPKWQVLEGKVVSSSLLSQSVHNGSSRTIRWVVFVALSLIGSMGFLVMRLRQSVRNQTAELRNSKQRLELALHSASDGVWERPDHREESLWISDRVYQMLGIVKNGYTPTFSSFCSFIHPEDVLQLRLAQTSAVSTSASFEVELRLNTVRGWRWFLLRGGVDKNQKGGRRITAVLQDIHESRQSLEILKANEARLRQYFEVGFVGMAMLDQQGLFTHVNSVLAEWLGVSKNQILGKSWREFTFEDDIPLEAMLFDELCQGRRHDYRLDKRMVRINDHQVWQALQSMRRVESSDFLEGNVVLTVLDVTDRQNTKLEQERLTQMLALKNRTLETALFAISHDFKKPIERLRESVDKLSLSFASGSQALSGVECELSQLELMLNALIRLSRLGSFQPEFRALEMTGLVNSVVQEMSESITQVNAEVCVFNLPSCSGNEIQLYQVFECLIDNCLRFRDPSRRCSVVISGEEQADRVRFIVRDNGVGIPLRHLDQVCTPFFSTWPQESTEKRLGIGLSVVSRIVENHAGHLQILSEAGKWTEVSFSLPKSIT